MPTWLENHQQQSGTALTSTAASMKLLFRISFRFFFAPFVAFENLQLLESAHKMASRPIYGRIDNCSSKSKVKYL
jgi:hypothetical protein